MSATSGTSPLAAVRDGMWGWLMLAGVAWLAVAWSVLRLNPADVVHVAGPVVLFGALCEAVRACAGARTWWMNAGMAVLFTATGIVLLAEQNTSYTTPAALIGWYLMVRGAVDVAVAMMTRETDRVWGLIMVVGVLEAGLGFFAASPLSRTADLVVTVVGGLGLLRAVADLVTGLRLREVRAARANLLDLTEERAAGLAGYTAGHDDFEPPRGAKPRHRAGSPIAAASPSGAPSPSGSGSHSAADSPFAAGSLPAGSAGAEAAAGGSAMWPAGPADPALGAGGGAPAEVAEQGIAASGGMAAAGYVAAGGTTPAPAPMIVPATSDEFHQEVLSTTANLDAMLALAGVTGAAVGHQFDDQDLPSAPDTAEGVETEHTPSHPGAA